MWSYVLWFTVCCWCGWITTWCIAWDIILIQMMRLATGIQFLTVDFLGEKNWNRILETKSLNFILLGDMTMIWRYKDSIWQTNLITMYDAHTQCSLNHKKTLLFRFLVDATCKCIVVYLKDWTCGETWLMIGNDSTAWGSWFVTNDQKK